MDNLNVWGVNWIDGMLVTSRHLNQQEEFAQNLTRWVASALAPGYGLAKSAISNSEPLEIQLARSGNTLTVEVQQCTALMPNGTIVNVNDAYRKHKALELKIDVAGDAKDTIPVYLYAVPNQHIQFGEPLQGEQLSRLPFQIPKLVLTDTQSEDYSSAAGMQIAEILFDGTDYELNEKFVPAVISTSCGKAVGNRMEQVRKSIDQIQRAALQAVAEVRNQVKAKPSAGEEERLRGIFLQSETLLHQLSFNYNRIFANAVGVDFPTLHCFFTGIIGSFQQAFPIYPDLREFVQSARLQAGEKELSGSEVLTSLRDYQTGNFGFHEMTQFFDATDKVFENVQAILTYYSSGEEGPKGDSIERDGFRFLVQRHGSVKYVQDGGRHIIVIDGVDPRATEDVLVRLHKKVLPMQYAGNVIIYLGANEVDDIAAASVARKPVEDVSDPDYWLIQPNEFFPLKSSRLDRLNVILDGEVDPSALKGVQMNHVAIFSRSR